MGLTFSQNYVTFDFPVGCFTGGQLGPNFDPKFDPNLFPNLHEVGGQSWPTILWQLAGNLESKVGTQSGVQVVVTMSIWVPTSDKRPNFGLPTSQNWDQSGSTSCATVQYPNFFVRQNF